MPLEKSLTFTFFSPPTKICHNNRRPFCWMPLISITYIWPKFCSTDPVGERGAGLRKIFLIAFLVFGFLVIGEKGFGQYLYKWVDKEGTLHLSESPPPKTPAEGKKQVSTENSVEILKRLEFGNRVIPDDMKKYGPGGAETRQSSSEQSGDSSSTSGGVRRS